MSARQGSGQHLAGKNFDQPLYEKVKELGAGSFGQVQLARNRWVRYLDACDCEIVFPHSPSADSLQGCMSLARDKSCSSLRAGGPVLARCRFGIWLRG